MVQNLDFEQLARSDQFAGDFDVSRTRCGVATGMIVLCEERIYVEQEG